ncbi:MAG TPA: lysophospholipid acyltransferase family protein [Candidatus Methylomirabilis sp.]|jgi:1-acyl-sn-glycerol-3-phosphate acyltransferase|nr:lysophospholipid acyltransferase family protein [Candidatus Methylomirabilis sp.]
MLYTLIRALALLGLKGFCKLRVVGREHVPERGGAIFAANHVSNVDPFVVGSAVRRKLHYLAKEELFRNPAAGWFMRQLQAFPISRNQADPSAFKRSLALLRKGEGLLVFPEGTRGDGRRLQPGKAGVGMLALRSGCPVIPVYHEGTAAVLPRGGWCPRPAAVRVWIGPPIVLRPPLGEGREPYEALSQQIMDAIARLQAGARQPAVTEAPSKSYSP